MREIKNRVILHDNVIGFEAVINSAWHWWTINHPNNKVHGVWDGHGLERDRYTGLKDKSGVEIYEGDIVSDAELSWRNFRAQVIWDTDGARFDIVGPELTAGFLYRRWEVIGNIYENPELLEKAA